MPGPWFLPREDEGAWKGLPAARGDYLELKLLDSTWHPQGMALVRVEEREAPARYGEWFQATIVAVSDGYLQWWLDQGEGSTEQRWFSFHVCAKTPATCRGSKGHPDLEFHLESLRSIPLAELGTAQQPAWLAQPAAAVDLKWELDRLGGQPPPPKRPAVGSSSAEDANAARTGRGGAAPCSEGGPAPPVPSSYLLTIMVPEFRTKLGIRQLRELKTLCRAVDLVVEGEARPAADILAQRAVMAARELALKSKLKEAGQKMAWAKGKGRWGGKSEPPPLQLAPLRRGGCLFKSERSRGDPP
eukprot:s176_g10.t1